MALTAHTGWITFSDLWRISCSSRWSHCLSGCGLLVLNLICTTPLAAQSTTTNAHLLAQVTTKKAPPEPIDPASLTSIEEIQKLRQVSQLKDLELPRSAQPADIQVFPKAIDWALRHEEIRNSTQRDALVRVTRQGLNRVAAAEKKEAPWLAPGGQHVLGYVSEVDESIQPYSLWIPEGYQQESADRWPLEVVLHGRDNDLNEVKFIDQHEGKTLKQSPKHFRLEVFGRGNNAYRWAGETDVFEAIRDVIRRFRIDDQRINLWGFSMGGAGAWHLGVHHPDQWSSVGAGAGFADTIVYQKLKEPIESPRRELLRIYDAIDYAPNAGLVPMIGYGGSEDPQLAAAQTMQKAAREAGVEIPVLIGQGVAHKWHPESEQEFQAFHDRYRQSGRVRFPLNPKIRFTTWTVKYPEADWLKVIRQEFPYQISTIDAEIKNDADLVEVSTKNVAILSVDRQAAESIRIDGSEVLPLRNAAEGLLPDVYYELRGNGWKQLEYKASRDVEINDMRHKHHRLQGPIDDAFTQPFVHVTGSGRAWNSAHEAYTNWSLKRSQQEFDRWLRGRPPAIVDNGLSDEILMDKNLILCGDPGSNTLIARIVDQLPIEWTKDRIVVNGKEFSPQNHAIAMIVPNPLNSLKYVVINSGHTFHEAEFKGSNAQLYPRLGDLAVIRFEEQENGSFREEIVENLILDSRWQIPQQLPADAQK